MRRVCPHCKHIHNRATGLDGRPHLPREKDHALCFDCGAWMVITQRGLTRKPTPDEIAVILADHDCQLAALAWTKVKGSVEG
jgi:hypothetical protein